MERYFTTQLKCSPKKTKDVCSYGRKWRWILLLTLSTFDIGKHSSWMTETQIPEGLGVCDRGLLCRAVFSTQSLPQPSRTKVHCSGTESMLRGISGGRRARPERLTGYITNPYCGRLSLGLTYIFWHWDHSRNLWPSYNCQTFKWPWCGSWFITLLASNHMITWLVLRFSSSDSSTWV